MAKNILSNYRNSVLGIILLSGSVLILNANAEAQAKQSAKAKPATASTTTATAGLKLPAGFSATIVADNLGRARHIAVTPQNDIYVRLARPKNGHGTLMLHEVNGKATV